jgi:aminoglycoside phosphotransferase family enzyme/predicted kinase
MSSAAGIRFSPYLAVRETHAAVVFLIGDRACKMKKPVDLGFLDFSTEPARREACHREVALNRRLAPDVYLGVADVTGPDGRSCEHLVVMRRMPEERRLSTLIATGAPVDEELRRIAHLVAAFHGRSERSTDIAAAGSRDALRARWTASFDQVRPFHGTVLDPRVAPEVERLTLRFLAGREPLFDARLRDNCVVDGHGDLLADDIFCLPDGPRILDCLEFDDQLRHLDRLDDAAFLAMDLEHLGVPDLAARFLAWYVEFVGDLAPPSLLHHYLAYRAFVRAKVACLRHAQGDPAAAEQGRGFTAITHRHLATAAVSLVLVGGPPGTGKSTVAGGLADRLGLTVLSSDRVRKELAGLSPDTPAPAGYREGIYTPAWTERTYTQLLTRAERLLALGESVVLDASWSNRAEREAAASVARRTASDLVALRCRTPPDVAATRMRQRRGVSDANETIAAALLTDADPWPEATVVDTTVPKERAIQRAVEQVRPSPGSGHGWRTARSWSRIESWLGAAGPSPRTNPVRVPPSAGKRRDRPADGKAQNQQHANPRGPRARPYRHPQHPGQKGNPQHDLDEEREIPYRAPQSVDLVGEEQHEERQPHSDHPKEPQRRAERAPSARVRQGNPALVPRCRTPAGRLR